MVASTAIAGALGAPAVPLVGAPQFAEGDPSWCTSATTAKLVLVD
jgi:hypothetical protein